MFDMMSRTGSRSTVADLLEADVAAHILLALQNRPARVAIDPDISMMISDRERSTLATTRKAGGMIARDFDLCGCSSASPVSRKMTRKPSRIGFTLISAQNPEHGFAMITG